MYHSSGLMIRAALATAVFSSLPLPATAQTGTLDASADGLLKAIRSHGEADRKLKASYQKVTLAYKQAAPLSAALANANANLLDRRLTLHVRGQLQRQANKLEADLKAQQEAVKGQEAALEEDHTKLLEDVDKSCAPILRGMQGEMDPKGIAAVFSLLDMFVFSEFKELPHLKIGSSFLDRDAWKEAGRCLAAAGMDRLPDLKKAMDSPTSAVRYAAVAAIADLGPEVDKRDKEVFSKLAAMNARLAGSKMERQEREARQKLVKSALAAVRPDKK